MSSKTAPEVTSTNDTTVEPQPEQFNDEGWKSFASAIRKKTLTRTAITLGACLAVGATIAVIASRNDEETDETEV